MESNKHKFLVDLTEYVTHIKKQAMFIPVMLKPTKIPDSIAMLSKIGYEPDGYVNFYNKLFKNSLKLTKPIQPKDLEYDPRFRTNYLKAMKDKQRMENNPVKPITAAEANRYTLFTCRLLNAFPEVFVAIKGHQQCALICFFIGSADDPHVISAFLCEFAKLERNLA